MSEKRDYYEVLGVEKRVSGEELKKAFRRLAMITGAKLADQHHRVLVNFRRFALIGLESNGVPSLHVFSS